MQGLPGEELGAGPARLAPDLLEHLCDRFDRRHLGLLLIGMPGIEKRLGAYPQLYSRLGFATSTDPSPTTSSPSS